jgi:hypothetical protein
MVWEIVRVLGHGSWVFWGASSTWPLSSACLSFSDDPRNRHMITNISIIEITLMNAECHDLAFLPAPASQQMFLIVGGLDNVDE